MRACSCSLSSLGFPTAYAKWAVSLTCRITGSGRPRTMSSVYCRMSMSSLVSAVVAYHYQNGQEPERRSTHDRVSVCMHKSLQVSSFNTGPYRGIHDAPAQYQQYKERRVTVRAKARHRHCATARILCMHTHTHIQYAHIHVDVRDVRIEKRYAYGATARVNQCEFPACCPLCGAHGLPARGAGPSSSCQADLARRGQYTHVTSTAAVDRSSQQGIYLS